MLVDAGIQHRLDYSGSVVHRAYRESDFPNTNYVCELTTPRRRLQSAKIIQFPVCHLPGIDYETPISKHGRDTPIPQSVEGAASTYTAARHYVFNSYRRAGRGTGKSYLCRFTSIPTQYSRFFRRAFLLLPELGGATGAKASL